LLERLTQAGDLFLCLGRPTTPEDDLGGRGLGHALQALPLGRQLGPAGSLSADGHSVVDAVPRAPPRSRDPLPGRSRSARDDGSGGARRCCAPPPEFPSLRTDRMASPSPATLPPLRG